MLEHDGAVAAAARPPSGGSLSPSLQVGPVSMQFEIPMYNVSNLQVRYLKIAELAKSYNPFR